MKKSDLVDALAARQGITKTQASAIFEDLVELLSESLTKGEKIDIRGFGVFSVRESAARTGRNPQTGEAVQIAAHRKVSFKAGKELRDRVDH